MTQAPDQTTVNSPAPSGPEAASPAKSEFDKLLTEFDSATANKATANLLKSLEPVVEFAQGEMNARETARIDTDLKAAVSFLKEDDAAKPLPDSFVKGFLREYATEHPEVAQAWENRGKAPSAWKSALGEAKKAFLEDAKSLPLNSVRTDVEAAAAAVRNQTTAPGKPESKSVGEMMNMSDRDWRAFAGIPGPY